MPQGGKAEVRFHPTYRFEILNMKMVLKFKITLIQGYLWLYIYPIKPVACLPNLMRLSLLLTIFLPVSTVYKDCVVKIN
jgi:hypothetical protein